MGFDNECILSIQSLPGEYFCPVCRLLVYPNEALQSQCTHLYCKPCLTYVVSTTHACPYDGYLVTETDSKPLVESNKALAEAIGKITVHCLYHRSGCTWQGPLSECTSHCSGCAFGNSAVVCNRCGIQIAHRQVQEHAQNCPGVQTQAQAHGEAAKDAAATRTTTADQAQATTQAQAVTPAQTSQTTTPSVSVQDPNQQGNPTTQPQPVVQATVPATEQWLQQQQPYQQYYQQYPGYDLYQQHYQQYYPYQQHAVLQYPQSQAYMQPQTSQPPAQLQTQHQAHPNIQPPAAAQTQSQPQVNPQQQTTTQTQSQTQSQTQPIHGHPHPQAQMHQQTQPVQHQPQNAQMPQYPQPYTQILHSQPQVQPQSHSLLHPQQPIPQPQPLSQSLQQTRAQHPVQHLPQPHASQPNLPVNPRPQAQLPHSSAVTGYHSYPQVQPQQQLQLGGSQHDVHTYPQGGPQSQTQQPIQMQGQFPRPPQSHVPIQNPQQSGLLPLPGQAPNVLPAQQQPLHPHPHLPGHPAYQRPVLQSVQPQVHQPFSGQVLGPVQNQVSQQGTHVQQQLQMHTQLRPQGLPQSKQPSHAYPQPQQNVAVPHGTPPYQTQNLGGRPMMPPHGVLVQSHPHSSAGMQARAMQLGSGQQAGNALRNNQNQMVSEQHSGAASRPMPERQSDHIIEKDEMKSIKSESDLKPLNDDNKSVGDVKDVSETFGAENGEKLIKQVKQEPIEGDNDIPKTDHKESDHLEDKSMKSHDRNVAPQHSGSFHLHGQVQGESLVHPSHVVPIADQGKQHRPLTPHGHSSLQQRPAGSSLFPAPPPGPPHHMQLPGHPSAPLRPLGSGLPPNPPSEVSLDGVGDLGSTSVFGRGSIHHAPQGPFAQGERTPSYGHESDMFPGHKANVMDGRRVASGFRLRDDKARPLPDPSRIGDQGEFEDLKHFPKPSHLGTEKYGGHFPSRPLDRGPHSYGMDLPPKPFDSGPNALNYDSGHPGGPAPPRFFPPYRNDGMLHPNDLGEPPTGFHDNAVGRPDSAQMRPDYFGPPRYGRRHMDGMAPRSPGMDYTGFGAFPGPDDIAGREPRRFGDSFHGNRFPVPPSLSRRGELEGPGPDRFPKHFRRGEHLDPHDLPSRMRDPIGYGASWVGDFTGPDNFFHPRHAEPGYRSSFSNKGIPGDGGNYAGDLESFDSSKRRKSSSMVWCRICKVDCETVEGLDLHSQKRDHQKRAMDMVFTIKQNALKQKLASSDHLSLDDASKSRNTGFEGRGNKN